MAARLDELLTMFESISDTLDLETGTLANEIDYLILQNPEIKHVRIAMHNSFVTPLKTVMNYQPHLIKVLSHVNFDCKVTVLDFDINSIELAAQPQTLNSEVIVFVSIVPDLDVILELISKDPDSQLANSVRAFGLNKFFSNPYHWYKLYINKELYQRKPFCLLFNTKSNLS